MNKEEFLIKKDNISKQLIALEVEKKNLTKQYLERRKQVELAKKRVELEPELKKVLEAFQRKEQEKLVGINQKLLTAILQDVIRNGDERQVVLDIFTERGLPALGIYIEKNGQGVLEDVYNGTGGAVANILSLGLRAIALIQSKKRRFLVLDESDCWIKPEIIPDFIEVIKQLSEKLKIQILVISHHEESLLSGIEHRLILEKDNGKIKTKWTNGDPTWNVNDDGIRSIYLENFQSHSSTYIPLSKTVTLLTGVNDLGKSTIVNALRAVFYGQADDTNIKHFEESAKVSVDFGFSTLFWERKLKGKPKECYILIDEQHGLDNPLHKTESARDVPEWLEAETGMAMIEGFDIQLGHQKRPVFLLDEPASKKAKALSIGDESNYVQMMINLSKEDLTSARLVVKQGEQEMEKIYKKLRIYEKAEYKSLFDKTTLFEDTEKLFESNANLSEKYRAISTSQRQLNMLNVDLKVDLEDRKMFSITDLKQYLQKRKLCAKLNLPEIEEFNLNKVGKIPFKQIKLNQLLKTDFDKITLSMKFENVKGFKKAVKIKSILALLDVDFKTELKLEKVGIKQIACALQNKNKLIDCKHEKEIISEALQDVQLHLKGFKTCPLCLHKLH